MRSILLFWAFALLLPDSILAEEAERPATGSLRGVVVDIETGEPIDYANILLQASNGTQWGTVALNGGEYLIKNVPAGSEYLVRSVSLGHQQLTVRNVFIAAGDTTTLNLSLESPFSERSREQRSIVGTLATAGQEDFSCYIRPMAETYRIGSPLEFTFGIEYSGSGEAVLVNAIDGSSTGARYPHVIIEVTDPSGAVHTASPSWCGNKNSLRMEDFEGLSSGDTFYAHGPLSFTPSFLCRYYPDRSGEYLVTFKYSSDEIDFAHWQGWPPRPLSDEVFMMLSRVSRIELHCAHVFVVLEE